MVRFLSLVLLALVLALTPTRGAAQPIDLSRDDAQRLATFVERRAAGTSFAALERFGDEAERRNDREGLNRLYHVVWTILNQGEFERATAWNDRLAAAAESQDDRRYRDIAVLNALTIRYDQGEVAVGDQMARYARVSRDWFVRAHAARLSALNMIDQGRVGEGLRLLSDAQADIPARDPFAATAQAGIWEMVGMGLMDIDDVEGAVKAFRRFEIDYSNRAYPRPDFDSLYNLTKMALRLGDVASAERYAQAHGRVAQRSDLPTLSLYDASLCAQVAGARENWSGVLQCLAPYGEDLGDAAFLGLDALPERAVARARLGQPDAARRDLERLRTLDDQTGAASLLRLVEAEVLFAEGRSSQAYALMRDYHREANIEAAQAFSSGVHQVTGDMQQQLTERREQLETARGYARLQQAAIAAVVIFLISVIGILLWQMRQGRLLKNARRRAEAANQAKSEFLANMSHEIRTPLNGVVSMADALSRRHLDGQERQMVELIRSSGATLERLLTDILDSAKIEAGQVTLEPTVFDLKHTVNDVALLWRAKAEDKGVALEFELDPTAPKYVTGDAVRLRQVLTNLVSNAIKFTDHGRVTLTVAPGLGDQIVFSVRDTGVGFSQAEKARIFRRFQQADGSITRRFGGTGLGLSISGALVELMGGEMDCESAPGEGAVFQFTIPLPTAAAPEAGSPTIEDADIAATPLKVLLADDHPANRKVIEIMLSATAMELVAVENGQEALDAFVEGGFDLVLMDMQMPVMDGLSATAGIRRHEAAQGQARTPVLMLTANAMAEHVEQSREAGADGHLTKPITLAGLFAAIAEAVGGGEAAEAEAA